jgi:hypothetical protein
MARSAIVGGYRVVKNRRVLTDRINTINHIVTFRAGLIYRVNDPVIEKTVQTEGLDVVADTAIDGHHRMADRLSRRVGAIVAGIAGEVRDSGGGVVGVGIGKISRVMAQFAFPG